MSSKFSEAYAEIVQGLANRAYSTAGDWPKLVKRARKLAGPDGFDSSEAALVDDLRKSIARASAHGASDAVHLLEGAGETLSGSGLNPLIGNSLAKRVGALKTLRHTYLLKRFGAHKVWCVDLPTSFTEWPHLALVGDVAAATSKLVDNKERFASERRKYLGDAPQEALKWTHKAMLVVSNPKRSRNFERIARWFADTDSNDADMFKVAKKLNVGFKKIAFKLKSGRLIYVDSVSERGTSENVGVEAFVWGDALDVVYIEEEFFGNSNTLTGLINWARIVVHELTHREVATKDHAYEHQGINPHKLTAAKAIENADSWAWFCADCAGALTDGVIHNALNR